MMMLALLLATAPIQQPTPSSIPPAPPPPPPPVANSPEVRAEIAAARTCYDQRWEESRKARFAAEDKVKPRTGAPGSPKWLSARTSVLALVSSRIKLADCVRMIGRTGLAKDEHDRDVEGFWISEMEGNIQLQAKFERSLLVALLDRAFADRISGLL